jgi:hypothetical protein
MSVEIDFGAGQSVTQHSPVRAVRGVGAVGNEVSADLCVYRSSPRERDLGCCTCFPQGGQRDGN